MSKFDTTLFHVDGDDELIANVLWLESALITAAQTGVEKGAAFAVGRMQRLVPEDTGELRRSIRFSFGQAGGEPRKTARPKSRDKGKTRIIGYIVAGDEKTMKGPKAGGAKPGKRKSKGKVSQFWQNAALQEFGTRKMQANPFFLPGWRSSRTRVQRIIAVEIGKAMRAARTQAGFAPKGKLAA